MNSLGLFKTFNKGLVAVFMSAAFLYLSKGIVFADTVCTPLYGGGERCTETGIKSIKIEKEASFKKDKDFSDRIKGADAKETVYFKITVKNEGDVALENLDVQDDLPKYLKTDDDTEWTIKSLEPGKEWSEVFKAEVVGEDSLPDSDTCVINEARVVSENRVLAEDTAVVCIEAPTKVLGITTLPVTGGSNAVSYKEVSYGIVAFGMLLVGLGLRKMVR